MADRLLRVEYDRPPIVKAVAQVMLSWTVAEMEAFTASVEKEPPEFFKQIERKKRIGFRLELHPDGAKQTKEEKPDELHCLTNDGRECHIGISGLLSQRDNAYGGRAALFEPILLCLERVGAQLPEILATRVSVLVDNMIEPPIDPGVSYSIQDYLTPDFSLSDPRLQVYGAFTHTIDMDLSAFGDRLRGQLLLHSGPDVPGLRLRIDVLDDALTPLERVESRLTNVKDIESHIFENCITDKTRNLYGCHL